ncbi:hypothetical protein PINS_up002156 [Pythium insidiosum]|nr:hypothetical protein PINS_up002156 [Pythium insidiosum]
MFNFMEVDDDGQRGLLRMMEAPSECSGAQSKSIDWRGRVVRMLLAIVFALGVMNLAVVPFARPEESRAVAVSRTDNITHHFATKTVYWDQRERADRGRRLRVPRAFVAASSMERTRDNASSVRLIQTQIIARHGIRYPTFGVITHIQSLLKKLSSAGVALPTWLHNYTLPYDTTDAGELSAAGVREMELLAKRLLQAHAYHSTKAVYQSARFTLVHTHVTRTKASAEAFAREYFANPSDVHYVEHPKHNDRVLRFFDMCDRYQVQVKANKSAIHEMTAFAQSSKMQSTAKRLHQALHIDGAQHTVDLSTTDIEAAFAACAFDIALFGNTHNWCALWGREMVETLDYFDDLRAFYQLAGGYPINYEMSAVLLQDVWATIEARVNGSSPHHFATFRFAHAETTLPLMTLLGFGRVPVSSMTASATVRDIRARGFRTSSLAPFGANIEFRLFELSDGNERRIDQASSQQERFLLQVLVNERDDVVISGCADVRCPLSTLERLWRPFLRDFSFDEQCRV